MDVSEFLRYSLVIVLLLCLFLSNSIYTLFQIYHNSRPPVQNNVINKLYVLLSIEYQLINISSVILLIVKFGFPSLGDDLANKIPLACICIFMAARGVLTGLLFSTLAVISLLRYLKEFHFKHFQIWPQATLLRISSFFCILPTVLTQMAIAIRCKGKEICNMELVDNIFNNNRMKDVDPCRVTPVLFLLASTFAVIVMCNFAHICGISSSGTST